MKNTPKPRRLKTANPLLLAKKDGLIESKDRINVCSFAPLRIDLTRKTDVAHFRITQNLTDREIFFIGMVINSLWSSCRRLLIISGNEAPLLKAVAELATNQHAFTAAPRIVYVIKDPNRKQKYFRNRYSV